MKKLTFSAVLFIFILILFPTASLRSEDGYRLWMRYDRIEDKEMLSAYRAAVREVVLPGRGETREAARMELTEGLNGMLGQKIRLRERVGRRNALVVGTPAGCPDIAGLGWEEELRSVGDEGFVIRQARIRGRSCTVIAANTDTGVLYGIFRMLRHLQTLTPAEHWPVSEKPAIKRRLLNHWDNLDGSIERGYAGRSLWKWEELPETIDPRYRDYARLNASIGINGTVLNNVNATPQILTDGYLRKAAALAGAFRPYGIRVYLAVNFSSPMKLGGLATADPLDPAVSAWWKAKADEIYRVIPDFGGFLVKANSEGLPGPQDFGRSHADGANMLADALAPHGGVVMWRAFVYSPDGSDRAGQGYREFKPLDGAFRPNVIIQVKNGPVDFQPREPFHPLFGAMPKTPVMPELQITQEYFGFSTHLVTLAPLYEECLDADTYAKGPGSSVSKVADGSLFGFGETGIAGVANTGTDRNWCGHPFASTNWYAFGRLAWDPSAASLEIAEEWMRMTLTRDPAAMPALLRLMLGSREAAVDYMTPFGLHHLMGWGHHYGPEPWLDRAERPDWNSVYYHRADSAGLGFDRSPSGSNAASQYFAPLDRVFSDPDSCPENLLLWFHHVPWDRKMKSGRTLWDDLCHRYYSGVDSVRIMRALWDSVEGSIDTERFADVKDRLRMQERDAAWWRDACVLYFQTFSKRPIPDGLEPPSVTLDRLKAVRWRPEYVQKGSTWMP
jgi:alpha-glucuronidase